MSSTIALGAALLVLASVLAVLSVAILARKAVRHVAEWRIRRLTTDVRPLLVALAGADEADRELIDELVGLDRRRWRALEPGAIALLGKIRGESQAALITILDRRGTVAEALRRVESPSPVVRCRAADFLGSVHSRTAVAPLVLLLADRDAEVRQVAARALGHIGDAAAAPALLDAAAGPRAVPLSVLARSLALLGPEVECVLVSALTEHRDETVRALAAEILGLQGAITAADAVVGALRNDPAERVRARAARALGQLGSPEAVPALLEACDASQPEQVRVAAVQALGAVATPDVVPVLAGLLADPAYGVAHEAAVALGGLGDRGAGQLRTVAGGAAGAAATAHAREVLALVELRAGQSGQLVETA